MYSKFDLQKIKIGRNIIYIKRSNTSVRIYNSKGKWIMSYNCHNIGICSIVLIQSINIDKNKIVENDFVAKIFKRIHQDPFSSYNRSYPTIISFQNVTKPTYNDMIDYGFIDYCRIPATYTSNNSSDISMALSIMVLSKRDLKPSIHKTISLMKNLIANGETL